MIPTAPGHESGTRRATLLKVLCAFLFTTALIVIPVLMPSTHGAFTASVKNPTNSAKVMPFLTCKQAMTKEPGGIFAYQLNTATPVNLTNDKMGTALTKNVPVHSGVNGCNNDIEGSLGFSGDYSFNRESYVTYNVPLSPPGTYTQEVWFRTEAADADWGGSIIAFSERPEYTSNGISNHQVYIDGDGILYMANDLGSKRYISVKTSRTVADANWHHVVAVRDAGASSMRLYLDGALVGQATAGQITGAFSPGYWRIGCTHLRDWPTNPWSGCFKGRISFAAVYNRAFTQQDVTNHYRAGTWKR